MDGDFELHPQLAADTTSVAELPLCRLLLSNDANFPWLILVPRRDGIREIHELDEADQCMLLRESVALSKALVAAFGGDKLNVAALGNVVPQLHVHHIVRYRTDPAWPAPVWGRIAAAVYDPAERQRRIDRLRATLPVALQLPS
jgi:diadenosine tetraphosphate (Ap4A) HIT family hydrolase